MEDTYRIPVVSHWNTKSTEKKLKTPKRSTAKTDKRPLQSPSYNTKPKETNKGTAEENPAQRLTRRRKRIIRREELPASKLSNTKAPPKPKPKPKKATKPTLPKKPGASPSAIRLANLNAHLSNDSEAWREFRPLVIGVEKEVFRYIAALRQHTQDERYQRNLLAGDGRYHLDGTAVSG